MLAGAALLGPAPSALASAPGSDGRPIAILYEEEETARRIVTSPRGLTVDRGGLRQDPGVGGMFVEDGGDPAAGRVAKLPASALARMSVVGIETAIKAAIRRGAVGGGAHLVAIDEIGNPFSDGRARIRYRTTVVRGVRIRHAAHNQVVPTRRGYRIVRGRAPLPPLRPGSPGARLSAAMARLAERRSPYGGTWAERVHLYIAPAFVASVTVGRGPHRHLGNDGQPHRATWRGVMPALARAGGVWLEAYHFDRGLSPFTARELRLLGAHWSSYLRRFGGHPERLHLLFTRVRQRPAGAPTGCGAPQACQWALVARSGAGRRLLANGAGSYRVGDQWREWLAAYNAFTPS